MGGTAWLGAAARGFDSIAAKIGAGTIASGDRAGMLGSPMASDRRRGTVG